MILASWIIGPGTVVLMSNISGNVSWLSLPILSVLLAIGTALAGWLLVRGRRLVAQHAEDVMASDGRPPVLLLRSFADDQLVLDRPDNVLGTMFGHRPVTFEEMLADVCSWYGPVIAIGRPGETLPPLGAARLWVDHGAWQHKVATLLRDCGAVVMIMGAIKGKDGLAWEVETIRNLGLLGKLVLVVPPLPMDDWVKARWQSYQWLIRGKIPPYQGGEMVVTFDASGNAAVERKVAGWGGLLRDRKTYKRLLHAAVRRLAGKPRRPLAVHLAHAVRGAAFGMFVVMLFLGANFWKAEQDRKKHAEEERWRQEWYEPSPYRRPAGDP
jgi:hypothetical protein